MIQPKLTELLTDRNKSMYWLAQETGIAYTTLHRLGKARAKSVDFGVLDKICDALNCQPGDVLTRVTNGHAGTRSPVRRKGARAK
ncbi:MAG: helix-turn-helix domain-containing protein [Blastocatellia bacterium]